VMGLRLVKKTVNQDDPSVYHLFYSDENGSPGADITFFEYPGARPGRPGAGMIDRITHRVAGDGALDFWADRLGTEGVAVTREAGRLQFADPEGMGHELVVGTVSDPPLIAAHREVPAEFALQGFDAVHALVHDPSRSEGLVTAVLGFKGLETHDYEARGEHRGGRIVFEPSNERGIPGAGTVHHVAWAVLTSELGGWRQHVAASGARPTPVIDRFWFESVYFREPGGILYELATLDGAGFAADEEPELMGRSLVLPPFLESERDRIGPALTPLPDPSIWRPESAPARG
jgi:glyoxalase family protein